jgi:hypothetical protein
MAPNGRQHSNKKRIQKMRFLLLSAGYNHLRLKSKHASNAFSIIRHAPPA